MRLKENKKYTDIASAVQPMASAMEKIGRKIKPRKRVDVSSYKGLTKNVQGKTPKQTRLGAVTVPYGGSTKYEKFHPGVDIANKIGTNIPAFTSGKITSINRGLSQGDKGYGNYVVITDPQGNKHRYSHLNKAYVEMGQPIKRGEVLGQMGNTGQTYSLHGGTGSHLDYRVQNLYNKYVNPYSFITK